jgi:hypothetical protein
MNRYPISRREFFQGSLAASAALATHSIQQMFANSTLSTKAKPNILLIFSDQQHWRALGFMDSFFDTPYLDALARESIVFENSFFPSDRILPE